MSDIDYKRLAQEIVAEQSKEFLSFDEVCVMLGYKPRSSAVRKSPSRMISRYLLS